MKKTTKICIISILSLAVSNISYSQQWGTSGVPTSTQDGVIDMTITGDPTGAWRSILGGTSAGGISLFANSFSTNGPSIALHGTSYPNDPSTFEVRAGNLSYTSYYGSGSSIAGHRFLTYNNTNPISAHFQTNMIIGNDGRTIIGPGVDLSFAALGDNLTVRDQLGLFPSGTSAGNVRINGNTTYGTLAFNANTDHTNGASIWVKGGSIGSDIAYISSNTGATIGHQFMNYDPSSGLHNNMIIGNDGRMLVGSDMTLPLAAPGDVLTVKNRMGFYAGDPTLGRAINGNAPASTMSWSSNTTSYDGPAITMYGKDYAVPGDEARAGAIFHSAYGDKGTGHFFLNCDPYVPGPGTSPNWHPNMTIGKNGQVTIGHDLWQANTVAGDVLTVKDQMGFYSIKDENGRQIHGNTKQGWLGMYADASQTDGPNVEVFGISHSMFKGQVHYNSYGTTGVGHIFQSLDNSSGSPAWSERMAVYNDGKVAIGGGLIGSGNIPGGYLLYVEKGILTEKLKVANSGDPINWADFVFNADYDLMPLHKVEAYIKTNKHLPEIPSAKEVAADGIDVAEMDAKLLQKIEELTLYVIEQQKQLQAQQKEIDGLKKRH
jgi:hypothetical protein